MQSYLFVEVASISCLRGESRYERLDDQSLTVDEAKAASGICGAATDSRCDFPTQRGVSCVTLK